mgnify:CR=1 FL=1
MATVVSLGGKRKSPSLEPLLALCTDDMVRVDRETGVAILRSTEDRLVDIITDVADDCDVIMVSDYAKGVVDDALIAAALWAGREYGAPVIVDPKGRDFARYGAVDLIKPNASELAGATGLPVETDAEVEAALKALLAPLG